MSARVALAVAVVLAAGLGAGGRQKVAPMEKVSRLTAGASSAPAHRAGRKRSHPPARKARRTRRPVMRAPTDRVGIVLERRAAPYRRGEQPRRRVAGTRRPPRTGAQARHPARGRGPGTSTTHGGYYGGGYGSRWLRLRLRPYYGYGTATGMATGSATGIPMPTTRRSTSAATTATALVLRRRRHDAPRERLAAHPRRSRKARVYVDGYYAGIVDDFDGVFQRLNVPPGRHEITLKLEGYRTQHFKVYVPVDDTIKIHYDMVRGSGEATSEKFAGPSGSRRRRNMYDRRNDDATRATTPREAATATAGRGPPRSVRLQVSPRTRRCTWTGSSAARARESSSLRLRPGRHRIEVVRPGFRTVEREVEVERDGERSSSSRRLGR